MKTAAFQGYYSNLEKIAEYVQQSAQGTGLDGYSLYAIESAVDEACSNIIDHAYGGEGIGAIQCTCLKDENKITIILQDQGRPFDPTKICGPDLSTPLEDRQNHGFGLYFMKHFMDEIHFEFTADSGNILKMIKYIQPLDIVE
ncbi:MAG: ATP-binding protein [Anaerolineaceae bacterium]|nr:ATP-binding protein [Anaerolineaceae bacterium]